VSVNNDIPFRTSFGFSGGPYDASANAVTDCSLNSINTGFGYSCYRDPGNNSISIPPNISYFSNCVFNNISFPKGIRETTGNTVTLVANIYYIPVYDYVKSWFGTLNFNPLYANAYSSNLWPVVLSNYGFISSDPFTFPAGNTNWRTDISLNFTQKVIFTPNTVVLFQLVPGSGSGNVNFKTWSAYADPNGGVINSGVTGLRYDNTNLQNILRPIGYIGITPEGDSSRCVICNFNI
jgi:hypothetical protein